MITADYNTIMTTSMILTTTTTNTTVNKNSNMENLDKNNNRYQQWKCYDYDNSSMVIY